jgi:mitochondrial import receptor subunit TOM40
MAEKTQYPAPSAFSPYLETVASLFHPVAGPVYNSSARFHGWKESLGLVQPGTVENLTREVSRMSAACDRLR